MISAPPINGDGEAPSLLLPEGFDPNEHAAEKMRSSLMGDSPSVEMDLLDAIPSCVVEASTRECEVVFLGTGCAEPSKVGGNNIGRYVFVNVETCRSFGVIVPYGSTFLTKAACCLMWASAPCRKWYKWLLASN